MFASSIGSLESKCPKNEELENANKKLVLCSPTYVRTYVQYSTMHTQVFFAFRSVKKKKRLFLRTKRWENAFSSIPTNFGPFRSIYGASRVEKFADSLSRSGGGGGGAGREKVRERGNENFFSSPYFFFLLFIGRREIKMLPKQAKDDLDDTILRGERGKSFFVSFPGK